MTRFKVYDARTGEEHAATDFVPGDPARKQKFPRLFESLDGLLDYHERVVWAYWSDEARTKDDSYLPMMLLVCRNGDLVPVGSPMGDDAEKDAFTRFMRHKMREWRVVRYCMMSETWVGRAQVKGDPVVLPRDQHDRQEAMVLVAADRRRAKGRMLRMERDWTTGKVTTLVRDGAFDSGGEISGRFATMLMPDPDYD